MNMLTTIHCEGDYRRMEARCRELEAKVEQLEYERDHWKREAGQLASSEHAGQLIELFGLTAVEALICAALYHRREKLLPAASIEGLLDEDRGHPLESNVVAVMISRIRDKLGDSAVETVRGRGYRLAPGIVGIFDKRLR